MPPAARRARDAVAETATLEDVRAASGAPAASEPRAGQAPGPGSGDPLVGDLRRAGLLPLLVLHFIAQNPSYGNQLIERVSRLTGGSVAVNPNTMYPLLRALESKGLVAGEWEHPERRSRRFYTITDAGQVERDRLALELEPRLRALATGIEQIRHELKATASEAKRR